MNLHTDTVSLAALQQAFGKAIPGQQLSFAHRVIVLDGVPTATALPASVASLGTILAQVTLPIACGVLAKTKQLIAVAVAHVTQCPYCIRSHTATAMRHGASPEEIMEAIWVAVEMRAGGAYAHSALALDVIGHTPPQGGVR